MKAAARSKYGPPEILSIKEFAIQTPKDNEVLIKVHATTVNRSDCHVLTGSPFMMRFFTGLFKPALAVTGSDFAGEIEEVGKNVTSFKIGDKVMGFGGVLGCGSHAQYLAFPEDRGIVLMPDNIDYYQAAACLEGAFYALEVVNYVKPEPGQKALVYGATGAIGLSALQFLKCYGSYVTAVCGGENRGLIKSLGADKIIDYKSQDFTKDNEEYDFIFDAVGKSSFGRCRRLLTKKGIYTSSGGGFDYLFLALITPLMGGKKVLFRPPKNIKAGLNFIKTLVENGRFRPIIDRTYPIDQIADAYRYVLTGEKIGNVIIAVNV